MEENILNIILPKLITHLIDKGVRENDIREISLNEQKKGTYVLINHIGGYCRNNRENANDYSKQFHAEKSLKTNKG